PAARGIGGLGPPELEAADGAGSGLPLEARALHRRQLTRRRGPSTHRPCRGRLSRGPLQGAIRGPRQRPRLTRGHPTRDGRDGVGVLARELSERLLLHTRRNQAHAAVLLPLDRSQVDDAGALVQVLRRSLRRRLLAHLPREGEHHRAQGDAVALVEDPALVLGDELAVDLGAVRAAAVLGDDVVTFQGQARVAAGNAGVVQDDITVGRAADAHRLLIEDDLSARLLTLSDRQQEVHLAAQSRESPAAWATAARREGGESTRASPAQPSTHRTAQSRGSAGMSMETLSSGPSATAAPYRSRVKGAARGASETRARGPSRCTSRW